MNYVLNHEEEKERKCEDMHLTESYDIKSIDNSGDVRYIEVKGHGGVNRTAELTRLEREFAIEKGDDYWLYIVYDIDFDSATAQLFQCRNPIKNMRVEEKVTYRYLLSGRCHKS